MCRLVSSRVASRRSVSVADRHVTVATHGSTEVEHSRWLVRRTWNAPPHEGSTTPHPCNYWGSVLPRAWAGSRVERWEVLREQCRFKTKHKHIMVNDITTMMIRWGLKVTKVSRTSTYCQVGVVACHPTSPSRVLQLQRSTLP